MVRMFFFSNSYKMCSVHYFPNQLRTLCLIKKNILIVNQNLIDKLKRKSIDKLIVTCSLIESLKINTFHLKIIIIQRTEERSVQLAVRVHRTLELADDKFYVITCGKGGYGRLVHFFLI